MASKGRSNLNKNELGISTNFFGNYDMYQECKWLKGKNTIQELLTLPLPTIVWLEAVLPLLKLIKEEID